MSTITLTTWSLEMTSPADLVPAAPAGPEISVVRSEVPSPEFSRFLYASVGGDIHWTDRLSLTRAQWVEQLDRPGVETWVAYDRGTPAGYVELDPQDDGVVEIMYFGLLPDFRGRRIGGHLLTVGVERAWDLASRWPQRAATPPGWVDTGSPDGPPAVAYKHRRCDIHK
ncbi:GNAT family N-acetyltransferase, partial [Streptomyces amritsarensis]|uniref:GNAT family N-acetyltransferase n=1 Tax=Streptomyces amritsarensis TaxID=681158 RepID=UPI0036B24207